MAQAYRQADLSLVYPLARGTAPLLLAVWAVLLLAEPITPGGLAGIGLIALGLYGLNLPRLGAWSEPLRALRQPGPRLALLAGACISAYTAIDRVGVRQLDPLLYTCLALWLTALLLAPYALLAVGPAGLWSELRAAWPSMLVAGFTSLAAYAMVLSAMRAGTPASYAGATREVSVVLGAAVGVWLLKEKGSAMRLAGAASVAAGVALIALFG
jgi:drug/metabolite transporter (DMT)-like permease